MLYNAYLVFLVGDLYRHHSVAGALVLHDPLHALLHKLQLRRALGLHRAKHDNTRKGLSGRTVQCIDMLRRNIKPGLTQEVIATKRGGHWGVYY